MTVAPTLPVISCSLSASMKAARTFVETSVRRAESVAARGSGGSEAAHCDPQAARPRGAGPADGTGAINRQGKAPWARIIAPCHVAAIDGKAISLGATRPSIDTSVNGG